MVAKIRPWSFQCPQCRTWGSTLAVNINGADHRNLDEERREAGLAALRDLNNAAILDQLRAHGMASGGRLLDVGSAHGWFVLAARAAGMAAEGIEPDERIAAVSTSVGAAPRIVYFPAALAEDERFDVISFNDVLEHIPDVRAALAGVRDHLSPSGLLSVNIPNSGGIVYRAAVRAAQAGVGSVFERLWQLGLPSPHVWYFGESGLTTLCASVGLDRVHAGRLTSLTRAGLWERAHDDRRPSPVTVASVGLGWLAAPALNSSRTSDIMHLIFRRHRDG